MLTTRYSITREPRGQDYRALLELARPICSEALMVLRPTITTSGNCQEVLDSLSPYILARTQGSTWPGTRLLRGEATIFRLAYEEGSVAVLQRSAEGLFGWVQPELPEDLCLIRAGGDPWLVSIAHEHDAYLDLTEIEHALMRKSLGAVGRTLAAEDVGGE